MKILVIDATHGGLIISEAFSKKGNNVTCIDVYKTLKKEDIEKYSKDSETYRLTELIIPLIEEFSLEIRRSLIYYQGLPNFSGKKFLVILGGGTSRLKGLVDYVGSYLKVETILDDLLLKGVVYNPKLFTEDYLREMSPFFTVAVGLAMREAFEKIEKSKLQKGGKVK